VIIRFNSKKSSQKKKKRNTYKKKKTKFFKIKKSSAHTERNGNILPGREHLWLDAGAREEVVVRAEDGGEEQAGANLTLNASEQ
jgi:hypothetical protein